MTAGVMQRARRVRGNADLERRIEEIDQMQDDISDRIADLESEIEDHVADAQNFREEEAEARREAEREETAAQDKRRRLAELNAEWDRLGAESERLERELQAAQ